MVSRSFGLRHAVFAVVAIVAVMLVLWPPAAFTRSQAATFAAVLLTLGLWGTALVPGYFASLLFFAVTLIAGLASPAAVFSGFSSAAVWLIISGFVIGSAIGLTGLGDVHFRFHFHKLLEKLVTMSAEPCFARRRTG